MPTRLDPLHNPEHLQFLIDNGLIWQSAEEVLQHAVSELQDGNATRSPEKEPPEIRAFLDDVLAEDETDFLDDPEGFNEE